MELADLQLHAGRFHEAAFLLAEVRRRWPEARGLQLALGRALLLQGEVGRGVDELRASRSPLASLLADLALYRAPTEGAERPPAPAAAEVLSRTRAALGSAKSGPAVVRIEAAMLAGWLLCVLPPSLGCRGRGYGLLLGAWRELEDGALSDSRLPGQRDRLRINAAWLLLRSSPRAVPVADSDAPGRDVLVARICCLDPACSFAEAAYLGDDDGRPNEPA